MKGIQINNFFNNHISLSSKKNIPKQPNMLSQAARQKPIVFNHKSNQEEPQQMSSYDALTPQMKALNKEPIIMTRKKRTNTIDPTPKPRQNKHSKGKKLNSYEKFRKTVSLDKYNDKQVSEQHDVSKNLNKHYKKPKSSRNNNEYQPQSVKRSKSAIIKHTNSKTIQTKQPSKQFKQFIKQSKNNIFSADISSKDLSKKQIKKQTQNLINKKQSTEKVQCKTARVQSTKVKPRKNKDKIIAQIQKSPQKDNKKSIKYHTQKKTTCVTGSKSYLTSAKQSKPVSARGKKPSKKLFDNKEKDAYKIEDQGNSYQNLQDFINDSGKQENSEVKEALTELQFILQGISSKKGLAKELKKFTFKLKNIASKKNSDNQSQLSEDQQSNSQAFKRIKDFKNNLVKKKLNEVKQTKTQDDNQSHRQKVTPAKKSSKKLLKPKKKLEDPQKNNKNPVEQLNLNQNQGHMMESSDANHQTSEPQIFKNTDQEQSKYINSRNVSQFYQKTLKQTNIEAPNAIYCEEDDEDEVLDSTNKKYMQFLKNLEAECQNQNQSNAQRSQIQKSEEKLKSENFIDDINNLLNRENIQTNKEYNSERPNFQSKETENSKNPMLQRRRADGFPVNQGKQDINLKDYLSDHENQSSNEINNTSYDFIEDFKVNREAQIQELKAFINQSDQMMSKVGIKKQQKKKNLTIQLNQNSISEGSQIRTKTSKTPSSPKYDDRYPHMIKSPKFSDIEITNILAAKQRCLASKHQKMNELVQKMYQKQLVSPKSYEYYVYQLKKQFQQQSQGLGEFKQQASQILHQINQEKNDIKAIDQLIREEKWGQARNFMKGEQKGASGFFGFRKNKQKIYETFNSQQKIELNNQHSAQLSPTKKHNIGVIKNNINITIQPSPLVNPIISEIKGQIQIKNSKEQKSNQSNLGLIRQQRNISLSSSEEEQYQIEQDHDSITKKLDFQFQEKYRLKSNEDLTPSKLMLPQQKFQTELDSYLNAQRAESQDFQSYVYYQSQSNDQGLVSEQSQQVKTKDHQQSSQRLKPEGIFKLIEVSQNQHDQEQHEESSDLKVKDESVAMKNQIFKNTIQIDQRQPKQLGSHQEQQQLIKVPNVQESDLQDDKHSEQQSQDEDISDSGSILQMQLRKGFESNLFFIKEYCISLCEYIRDNSQLKNQFKLNISQPLQFNTEDLLKKYRKNIDDTYSSQYDSTLSLLQYKTQFRRPPNKAINLQLANQFNKTYGPLKFWNRDLNKKGRQKFLMEKQAQSIFLSAILEVLNQSLDFQRPGSIFGKPLTWANNSKHLKNMKYLNGQTTKKVCEDSEESAETYDFIFGVAIARIIQWGSCLCGFLPDTAELQNTQIDDDYVVHIRQTRMAFLLQKMLADQQVTFNNSELQETEIMLCVGKAVAEQLMKEASEQILKIGKFIFQES